MTRPESDSAPSSQAPPAPNSGAKPPAQTTEEEQPKETAKPPAETTQEEKPEETKEPPKEEPEEEEEHEDIGADVAWDCFETCVPYSSPYRITLDG